VNVASRRRIALAGLLFCGAAAAGLALDPSKRIAQYGLDLWGSRQGLPQNSVASLLQTRDGYLWFGTEEGLVRFDGVRFTVFSARDTPGFTRNSVTALAEGSDGSLWIGTTHGLVRKTESRFTRFAAADGLPDESIRALAAGADGTIWIGTGRGGLARWRNGQFEPPLRRADGLPGGVVFALAVARDGTLWIGTDGGLARLRGGRIEVFALPGDASNPTVNDVDEGRDGAIWVATDGQGLFRIRGDREVARFAPSDGLPSGFVYDVREDRDQSVWIATGGGLARLRDGVFERFASSDGLPNDLVVSLCEDREGSLWIGIDQGGLVRLRDAPIVSYSTRDGLSSNLPRVVLQDRDGTIWIGARGGGLTRYRDGRFTPVPAESVEASGSVSALAQSRDGSVWVGLSSGGLARFENGRLRVARPQGLPAEPIRVIHEDRDGALWVGTTGGGVARVRDGRATVFRETQGLANDSVKAMAEGRDGALWVGTFDGLSRYEGGRWTTFREKDGLSSAEIDALRVDADGTLWIGTDGGGLVRYRDGHFAAATVREGLFDNLVFSILDDDRGNFWMSCNRGVYRVARRELEELFAGRRRAVTSVSYGEADGMASAECNGSFQSAAWRARDGRLWFPTVAGIAVLDPVTLRDDPQPPPVLIERVLADGRETATLRGARFPAGTRSLEFQYTGLSLVGPERIRFRHRLEGFDADWTEAGTRRSAFYTNLGPGSYVFRVAACNAEGIWKDAGTSLAFSIAPRLTQRPVFLASLALAALATAFTVYLLRVRGLRRRARELEAGIADALSKVRTLRGLFPICASCKKIRDDKGYWSQIEGYVREHSEAEFSHSICPDCIRDLYPDYAEPGEPSPQSSRAARED
jgi:ligand-binding sensor domain-containing protein